MDNTLDKFSVINDDAENDYEVKQGNTSSGCLKHQDKFDFTGLDIDPASGFSLEIAKCGSTDSETLELMKDADGEWSQTINSTAGPSIRRRSTMGGSGDGPLFHLILDPDQDGVVIVGTVDVDGPPDVARVGNREGLHA